MSTKKKIFISSLITLVSTITVLAFWGDIGFYLDHYYHRENLQMDFLRWMLYQDYLKASIILLFLLSFIVSFFCGVKLAEERDSKKFANSPTIHQTSTANVNHPSNPAEVEDEGADSSFNE